MVTSGPVMILHVDDNESSRFLVSSLLRQAGFTVREARTGRDALRELAARPDLVLLDVNLPDMSGFDVCREIKKNPGTASIPVLHLSGTFASSEARARGLEAGADGYLTKPVAPEELIAQVNALLRVRKAEEEARTLARQWQATFDALSDGVCLVDRGGRVLRCNRALANVLGRGQQHIVGQQYRALVAGVLGPSNGTSFLDPPASGARKIEERSVAGRWFRITTDPVFDERGVITGTTHVWTDFTERKRGEEERRQREEELRRQHTLLKAVMEGTTDAVFIKDRQGRYLMINSAGARFLGKNAEEVCGKTDADLFSPETARRLTEDDRRIMASGQTETAEEELVTASGVTRAYLANKGPFRGPDGTVVGLIGISRDVTERKRAVEAEAERLRLAAFSAEVGVVLTQARGAEEMLQGCAEAMVRHLDAAFARIWTLDPESDTLELQASAGLYTHRDGPHSRIPVGRLKIGCIARELRPHLTNDVPNDPLVSDPEWARREGMTAFAGHPLVVGGQLLGVMGLFARRPLTEFTLKALAAAADSIALGIKRRLAEETIRVLHAEFRVARKIQQHLFPVAAPRLPGFDVHGASHPAEATGGDYFDFIGLSDGTVGVVIGDVSGHGFGPALLMSEARAYMRAFALTGTSPHEILTLANRVLGSDTGEDRFITAVFGRLDPRDRTFAYASAGHLSGYLLDAAGTVKATLGSTGCPLGIFPDSEFQPGQTFPLEPGDLVLLLTDGIVEARSPDDTVFGAGRALDIVRCYRGDSAAHIVNNLYHAVRAFAQNRPLQDDFTAVVIKVDPRS